MRVSLDPAVEVFLGDHQVEGAPLLPTVMGLDLHADAALRNVRGARVAEIHDVRVGPPVRFPHGRTRTVHAAARQRGPHRPAQPRAWQCQLRQKHSDGSPGTALSCVVLLDGAGVALAPCVPTPARRPTEPLPEMPVRAEDVYPPYFHGPRFRVVGAAGLAGDGAGLVAWLAPSCPELRWSSRGPVTAPVLLELVMQVAGLWELIATGRIMIPYQIDRIVLYDVTGPPGRTTAYVRPRADAEGVTAFDADVTAEDGRLLLRMAGYRTVGLGQSVDRATSDGLKQMLGNPRPVSAVGAR